MCLTFKLSTPGSRRCRAGIFPMRWKTFAADWSKVCPKGRRDGDPRRDIRRQLSCYRAPLHRRPRRVKNDDGGAGSRAAWLGRRHRKSSFIALLRQRTGLRRHGCRRNSTTALADPVNVDPLGSRAEIPLTNPPTDPGRVVSWR